jgi:hypothetical protein
MNAMKKALLETKLNRAFKNQSLLLEDDSANDTSTVGGEFAQLILPLIKKIYPDSLVAEIADIQPLSAPMAKVGALYSLYTGSDNSALTNTHVYNSFVVSTPTAGVTVNDEWTGYGSTYTVRYLEEVITHNSLSTYYNILLSMETGSHVPVASDTFTDTTNLTSYTITYGDWNRAAINKIFRGYTGAPYGDGTNFVGIPYLTDSNSSVKYMGFETRTIDAVTGARKIKSKFSREQLQDILHIYKEHGVALAAESMASEIRQEIDKEVISYMKFISQLTTSATVNLSASLSAVNGDLQGITNDLIVNIYLAAERIVRDTKRNRSIFIMADPITTSFLQLNAFHTQAEFNQNNPYLVGHLGIYPLYCDLYADVNEHYVMVGYLGSNNNDGDSGIIYCPYTTTLHVAPDPTYFTENMLFLQRYAMIRHPQDLGNVLPSDPWNTANASNSDFFKMFLVNFGTSALVNFSDISIPVFQ